MAAILKKAWDGYLFLFDELTDPRTQSWPLIAKPYQGLLLLSIYLMFVLKWGPRWMKNRRPFNLDQVLIVYNALQVIACAYIFVNAIRVAWLWDYKWICEPVDFSNNPKAMAMTELCYMYFLLKVVDLLDTVFFVLRKKNIQVSFLHIYHHAGMVMLIWGATTYYPGGHGTLIGVMNCFVHVVMYAYYLLTVAMPSIKQEIWLKKLVTQLQILQFFFGVVHMSTIVFRPDCGYPRWSSAVFLPQDLFMLVLFIDFYYKTYITKPKQNILNNNATEITNSNIKNGNGVKYDNVEQRKNESNDINGYKLNNIDRNGFANNQFGSKGNIYEKVLEHNDEKYKKYD